MNYRKILEEHLGRKLTRDEIVHHIDGDCNNNSIDNLQIVSKQQHAKIHGIFVKDWEKELYKNLLEERDESLKKAIKSLKLFFTERQIHIIYKRFKQEPLSKTEKEYYSRNIKKKLVALSNTNLHEKSRLLLDIDL